MNRIFRTLAALGKLGITLIVIILDGMIKADGEKFKCKYDISSNKIFSQKNYSKINEVA